jgi:hypothetical protein
VLACRLYLSLLLVVHPLFVTLGRRVDLSLLLVNHAQNSFFVLQ